MINTYGRYSGGYTQKIIENMPSTVGFFFDYSSARTRRLQLFYEENGKIFRRFRYTDQDVPGSWSSWQQIYPDYSAKNLSTNGYITFNNGFTLQFGRINLTGANTEKVMTLPITSNIPYVILATIETTVPKSVVVSGAYYNLSTFRLITDTVGSTYTVNWFVMFNCFSDLHKDVYGVRPYWTKEEFDNISVEELEEKIKFLKACLKEEPYDPYDWENADDISQDDYEEFILSVEEKEREQRERIEDEYFESLAKTVKKRRQRVA